MKVKVRTLIVFILSAFLLIGIVSVAHADLTVYFKQNQSVNIPYTYNPDSAAGTNIILNDFIVGSTTISGAVLSFAFDTFGEGLLTVRQGTTLLYSAIVDQGDLTLIGVGANQVYQLHAYLLPADLGLQKYTFIWGQINLTFMPNGSYNDGGYFQVFGDSKTPIPGAVWLLGTGLFGLVAIRRRKKA